MTSALYEALSRQGHEVFVVSYFPPKTEEERNDDPHFMVLPSDDVLSEQNHNFLKEMLTKNAVQIVVNQTPQSSTVVSVVGAEAGSRVSGGNGVSYRPPR